MKWKVQKTILSEVMKVAVKVKTIVFIQNRDKIRARSEAPTEEWPTGRTCRISWGRW